MSQPSPFGPYPTEPYPSHSHLPPQKSHPIDVTVTIIELVLLGVGSLFVTLFFLIIGSIVGATGACRESGCDDTDGLIFATSLLLPLVLTVVAVVMSIVRMARRRIAFWIPPAALAIWILVQFLLLDHYAT